MAFASCHSRTVDTSESQLPLRWCHLKMTAPCLPVHHVSHHRLFVNESIWICEVLRKTAVCMWISLEACDKKKWGRIHIDPVIMFFVHFLSSRFMYVCLLYVHSERMQSAFWGTHVTFMALLFQRASERISGNAILESLREVNLSVISATSSSLSTKTGGAALWKSAH